MAHLNGMGMAQNFFRSASIDTGSECLLKSIKTETFRTLARKDIEEKLFQGMYPKHWNIRQNIRMLSFRMLLLTSDITVNAEWG